MLRAHRCSWFGADSDTVAHRDDILSTEVLQSSGSLIGDAAKSQTAWNLENAVFDAKRLIGRKLADTVGQADAKLWPCKVSAGAGAKPMMEVSMGGEGK